MTSLSQLTFTKPERIRHEMGLHGEIVTVSSREIENQHPAIDYHTLSMAIDPGKHFGVAVIGRGHRLVGNGTLTEVRPLREGAFMLARLLCEEYKPDVVVLEGASYKDRYGQVKLAEIRAGFALGASDFGVPVMVVAPKSPRKVVFGSGDTQAMDVWATLNHNAADALCLALYPYYLAEGRPVNEQIPQVVSRRHK